MELEVKLKVAIDESVKLSFNDLLAGDFFCYVSRLENEQPNNGHYAKYVRWAVCRKLSSTSYATALHGVEKQVYPLKDRDEKALYKVKLSTLDF